MLKRKHLFMLVMAMTAFAQAQTANAPAQPPQPRKVALIVQNHTQDASIPMMALMDSLTAKLSGRGFQVINPYNNLGVNQNRTVVGEIMPATSALNLARQLGAEGILTASVFDFNDIKLGTPVVLHQYSVRISINLADVVSGATICGETIKMISPKYTVKQDAQNRHEYLGDLLQSAAAECAAKLEANPSVLNWNPAIRAYLQPTDREGAVNGGKTSQALPWMQPPSTILDKKVDALVREMLLNPQFVKNYEANKAKQNGRLPVVVLGGIENKSDNANLNGLIEAAGERFRVKLFNSKLFEVKDDGMLVSLAKRIVASGNSPLEDGELMAALKQHGSPDFFVSGDLKRLTDLDGIAYYKFHLAIHSLSTGKIVWEGIETFSK